MASLNVADALAHKRARIGQFLQTLQGVEARLGRTSPEISALEDEVGQKEVRVVVVGEINRGKSTFQNALLGDKVFPPRAVVCTAVLTELRDGTPRVRIHRGTVVEEPELDADVTLAKALYRVVSAKNPEAHTLERVEVWYPNALARHGVVLVDTPGVNDTEAWRERITVQALLTCDAAVFLLDAHKPVTQTETDFLAANVLKAWGRKTLFVVNKCDGLSPSERTAVQRRCHAQLGRFVPDPEVFLIEARRALALRLEGAEPDVVESTGLPAVERRMAELLQDGGIGLFFAARWRKACWLAERTRASVTVRLSDLDHQAANLRAELSAARSSLARAERALEAGLQQRRQETAALGRAARRIAEESWSDPVQQATRSATLEGCLQAYASSRSDGDARVKSVLAQARGDATRRANTDLSALLSRHADATVRALQVLSSADLPGLAVVPPEVFEQVAADANVMGWAPGASAAGIIAGAMLAGPLGALAGLMGALFMSSELHQQWKRSSTTALRRAIQGRCEAARDALGVQIERQTEAHASALVEAARRAGASEIDRYRALLAAREANLARTGPQLASERTRLQTCDAELVQLLEDAP